MQESAAAGGDTGGGRVHTARDLFPGAALAKAAASVRGLYVHVPFCFHKCHYCDFYSIVDRSDRQDAYLARMEEEIAWIGSVLVRPMETIFVGGGTPTLLSPPLLARLLAALRSLPLRDDVELTVEANPETVTAEVAGVLADASVDRVSLGAQSFDPKHLKMLERHHAPESVERAAALLREAGIIRINLDLIFGIPHQQPDEWARDLERAIALEPAHLSCYGLMYEPGTALTRRLERGLVQRSGEDAEAVMFEMTRSILRGAGYEQYEISNFARPGERCRHNMLYWMNADWWPLGPSASGHISGVRWRNVPRLDAWLREGPAPPVDQIEYATAAQIAGERFMLGLRLTDGIVQRCVEELLAMPGGEVRRAAIERDVARGLLEWRADHLRLTDAGMLVADGILADLI